jgi:hypothetical protein
VDFDLNQLKKKLNLVQKDITAKKKVRLGMRYLKIPLTRFACIRLKHQQMNW